MILYQAWHDYLFIYTLQFYIEAWNSVSETYCKSFPVEVPLRLENELISAAYNSN